MKVITLTQDELNECLQAVLLHREMNDNEIVNVQMTKDDFIFNISTKDGELVLFNIITKEGKLLFDEEVIFIFILGDVIKAGRKNGEVIEINNILASK